MSFYKDGGPDSTPGYGYQFQMDNHTTRQPENDMAGAVTALQKFKTLTCIGSCLGILLIIAGAATLGVASENIGFPVFNFGPIIVGIVMLAGHGNGLWKALKALQMSNISQTTVSTVNCSVVGMFVVSVLNVTLAVLTGVVGLLAGLVCAGVPIPFTVEVNGVRSQVDTYQFCFPHDKANSAMGYVDFTLCILTAVWCIYGCIFVCCYGTYFGWRRYSGNGGVRFTYQGTR